MTAAVSRPGGGAVAARAAATASPSWALLIPIRSGGIAFALSGLLFAAAAAGRHPNIFDGGVGPAVQSSSSWAAIHLLTFGSVVAGWWGMVCAVARHRARLDRWADATLIISTLGAFMLGAVMFAEAIAFPAIADAAPQVLELDGPLFGSLSFRVLSALGGGYLVGLIALGALFRRAGVWPGAGLALAAATVAFMALAGPFVPVLGTLSSLVMGATLSWWGTLVWRSIGQEP